MRRAGRIVVGILLLFAPTPLLAQPPARTLEQLGVLISAGETVWLTDTAGHEITGRLTRIGTDVVEVAVDGRTQTWEAAQLQRVRHRHTDSLLNGVLIGAGIGAAAYGGFAAWWCGDENETCSGGGVAASIALGGAIGAGFGALGDFLVKGKRTVFERASATPSTSVSVLPVVGPGQKGLWVNVRF
jgi:hypothetical protein